MMDLLHYVILGVVAFFVLAFFFRHKMTALFYDYGIDFGLSTLDNFVAGLGLIGLDIGDWLAAIIIFSHEKKISGSFVAFFVAWEATNFLPLSFIPIIGEGIEVFFNLFPAVFASQLFFSKFSKAEKEEKHLEKNYELAKKLNLNVSGLEEVQENVEKNPVRAIVLEHRLRSKLKTQLEPKINEILSRGRAQRDQSAQLLPIPREIDALFKEAQELVKKELYAAALQKNNEAQAQLLLLTQSRTPSQVEMA